jgi:hypothetical protein
MIELNCTYEESKKILGLGYDFSKVCAVFSAKGQTMSHGLPFATMIINPFLKEVGHLENLSHLKSLPYLLLGKEIDIDSIIPIIPKAALEACLPLIDGVIWKRFPAAGDGLLRCTGLNHRTVETCTGFHEFLWCHENYPEELKKKFDEVMG